MEVATFPYQGHSYIVYGPLIKGCTTVMYEGKPVRTPDAGVSTLHSFASMILIPAAPNHCGSLISSYDGPLVMTIGFLAHH